MKLLVRFSLPLLLVVVLPSCRMDRWAQSHFDQGEPRSTEKELVRNEIRTASIYHELETVGLFDVLWLSDGVRGAYVNAYAAKYGLSAQEKAKMLHAQKEETSRVIAFYLIGYLPDNTMPPGDKQSKWAVTLNYKGTSIRPISVKAVDLNPEYHYFLVDKLSKHKNIYLVTFDAMDHDQSMLASMKEVAVTLATQDRATTLKWNVK